MIYRLWAVGQIISHFNPLPISVLGRMAVGLLWKSRVNNERDIKTAT